MNNKVKLATNKEKLTTALKYISFCLKLLRLSNYSLLKRQYES